MKESTIAFGSRAGLTDWIIQRISAAYLAFFVLYVLVVAITRDLRQYSIWKQWLSQGIVRLLIAGALLSLALHAWVGVRSVLLDYVRPVWVRLLIQSLLAVGLVFCVFWGAQILIVDVVRP